MGWADEMTEAEKLQIAECQAKGDNCGVSSVLTRARDRWIREQNAPAQRQYEAERAARRFEELAGLWPGALDAVIGALEEMEAIAREAEALRAKHGVVATECAQPTTSLERVALIQKLKAARG